MSRGMFSIDDVVGIWKETGGTKYCQGGGPITTKNWLDTSSPIERN